MAFEPPVLSPCLTAAEVIACLGLQPHPEGGHFVETFRHAPLAGGRGACTAIYYLLEAGARSAWHRIDATEIWHWYAGAALDLTTWATGDPALESRRLGPDLAAGNRPQAVVAAGVWQTAVSTGAWSLVGCTVAPAFSFDGFELAPPGWAPPVV